MSPVGAVLDDGGFERVAQGDQLSAGRDDRAPRPRPRPRTPRRGRSVALVLLVLLAAGLYGAERRQSRRQFEALLAAGAPAALGRRAARGRAALLARVDAWTGLVAGAVEAPDTLLLERRAALPVREDAAATLEAVGDGRARDRVPALQQGAAQPVSCAAGELRRMSAGTPAPGDGGRPGRAPAGRAGCNEPPEATTSAGVPRAERTCGMGDPRTYIELPLLSRAVSYGRRVVLVPAAQDRRSAAAVRRPSGAGPLARRRTRFGSVGAGRRGRSTAREAGTRHRGCLSV